MMKTKHSGVVGRTVRAIGIFIPIAFLLIFFDSYFAPRAVATFEKVSGSSSSVISDFEPGERVGHVEKDLERDIVYRRIEDEPVYFSVKMPRAFERARVDVEFINTSEGVVELGVQTHPELPLYDFQPLDNLWIDDLNWNRIEDEASDVVLLQRPVDVERRRFPRQYASIPDFLSDPPTDTHIAAYQFAMQSYYTLDSYAPSARTTVINTPLRGKHTMQTYIKGEELTMHVVFQDINRAWGADRFHLNVYNGAGELVYTDTIQDDGDATASFVATPRQEISATIPALPEGVYTIELDVSSDFILHSIETQQDLLVFKENIFPVGNAEYVSQVADMNIDPTRFFVVGERVTASTSNPSVEQTMTVGERKVQLARGESAEIMLDAVGIPTIEDAKEVRSPLNDVRLEADGYFVFSREQFFNPAPGLVSLSNVRRAHRFDSRLSAVSIDDVDYIIASGYAPPQEDGFWKRASVEFDLTKYQVKDNTVRFVLSAPQIANHDSNFRIHKVTVRLEKQPLTLTNILPRLKKFLQ